MLRLWNLAAVAALAAGCAPDSPRELRLGHGLALDHPVHRALVHLDEELDGFSAGRLRVRIAPAEQLGSERQSIELLQIGSLDATKTSAAVLEGFDPAFGLFSLPYLFDDEQHLFRALDGALGEALAARLERARLVPVAWLDAGSRSFYTVATPITTPEDLAGLEIRTQESAGAMRMVAALGATPTPIAWGELYSALQQGIVVGAENNPPSFLRSRHFEVARHFCLDEHTAVPDVVVFSLATWNRLTLEEREWVREAARHSASIQRREWADATAQALVELEAAGVTVVRPNKAAFRARVAGLWEAAAADPVVAPLLDLVAAARPQS